MAAGTGDGHGESWPWPYRSASPDTRTWITPHDLRRHPTVGRWRGTWSARSTGHQEGGRGCEFRMVADQLADSGSRVVRCAKRTPPSGPSHHTDHTEGRAR